MTQAVANHRDEPSTNASLLCRAIAGQEEGWQRMVQIYGPVVYRWIRGCGVQPADAADVMQETFLSVSSALPQFDPQRQGASFRGWLWTIARNKLRDRQRKMHPQNIDGSAGMRLIEQAGVSADSLAEPPSDLRQDRQLARSRALECLRASFDPRSWQMFWSTAVEDRDPNDVAEEMGVSRWAVYKARSRVLQRLRQEMAGLDFD